MRKHQKTDSPSSDAGSDSQASHATSTTSSRSSSPVSLQSPPPTDESRPRIILRIPKPLPSPASSPGASSVSPSHSQTSSLNSPPMRIAVVNQHSKSPVDQRGKDGKALSTSYMDNGSSQSGNIGAVKGTLLSKGHRVVVEHQQVVPVNQVGVDKASQDGMAIKTKLPTDSDVSDQTDSLPAIDTDKGCNALGKENTNEGTIENAIGMDGVTGQTEIAEVQDTPLEESWKSSARSSVRGDPVHHPEDEDLDKVSV